MSSYSLDFQGSTGNLAASTFNVDTVTVNGVPATFTRIENTTTNNAVTDNHKLVITPATPGRRCVHDGRHHLTARPVIHTDTDGSLEGWNNTTDGATFVNQPVGSMTLFPNNNTPARQGDLHVHHRRPDACGHVQLRLGGRQALSGRRGQQRRADLEHAQR